MRHVKRTFQFHKGAIRTYSLDARASVLNRFNSIKVQLEPTFQSWYVSGSLFQFHKGAIRTFTLRFEEITEPTFQFHKGAIRTSLFVFSSSDRLCFNSIKVQLEHRLLVHCIAAFLFQFHKGAIRTTGFANYVTVLCCFNSIKVQLELSC